MSDTVIKVDDLSKVYRIGARHRPSNTLRDAVSNFVSSSLKRMTGRTLLTERGDDILWALKEVSFEVKQGETVGIIGGNGAGKSTLLKILSRITEPSKGRIELQGRVASLLEVGTGFHPELSGRENIYLNGALLGMRKKEIARKFDEIVAFSEIEKFIDTPVKRYSSGMYVRLAFAVAAHLEPETLIIDEVLAVGDAAFQKKCLGKMGTVSKEGRTILFVSHNMGAIQSLTSTCILLINGQLVEKGSTTDVIQRYLNSFSENRSTNVESMPRIRPDLGEQIKICSIEPMQSTPMGFLYGRDITVNVTISSKVNRSNLRMGITVSDIFGNPVLSCFSPTIIEAVSFRNSVYRLMLKDTRLAPGTYMLSISLGEGALNEGKHEYDIVKSGPGFSICPVADNSTAVHTWPKDWGCIVHDAVFMEKV